AVYEGINVSTEERVAIKIILPHLAEDMSIQTLFLNEARTLTQLSHAALVQYRLLAREPQLGVFYIVTEFIDGPALSEVLSERMVSPEEFRQLAIRLASGLAAAHDLQKIHRDVTPDNVLLAAGRLDRAKIIDFGIAKDLSAVNKTVIGDGFAGKFAYVAPEQFDGSSGVGPWTDIYSLGLLLLAVALRCAPPMGATISGAVEARRTVPDLSAVPQAYRPVLAKMLVPDPANRYRSMRDVVTAFETAVEPAAGPLAVATQTAKAPAAAPSPVTARIAPLPFIAHMPRPVLIGAGAAVAAALLFVAIMLPWSDWLSSAPPIVPVAVRPVAPPKPVVNNLEKARAAMEAALGGIGCSWLDMDYPVRAPDGLRVAVSGVGPMDDSLSAYIAATLAAAGGAAGARVIADAGGVTPVSPQVCGLLDAFRAFREPSSKSGRGLVAMQTQFHLQMDPPGCKALGMRQARVVMDMNIGDPSADFALLGVDESGGAQVIFNSRKDFERLRIGHPQMASVLPNDSYRLGFCTDEKSVAASPNHLAGILLIKGAGPFDLDMTTVTAKGRTTDTAVLPADWPQRFASWARAGNWSTQMAWYQVLDN
ncbi:MAG TPA: serine/threonine-protein kinase, partial [Rhizomicrobium sp.]